MVGGRGLGRWISHSLPLAPSVCLGARVRVASLCGRIVWSGGGCLTCGELAVLCCVALSRRTCVLSVDAPSMQLCGAVGTCGEMTAPQAMARGLAKAQQRRADSQSPFGRRHV